MSGLLMGMVWNYHVTGNERDVLLAMADHAHDDGSSCYPSVPRLAWKIGISERTIQRIIAKMVAGEVLELVGEASYHRPREYRIDLSKLRAKAPLVSARGDRGDKSGVTGVTKAVVRGDTIDDTLTVDNHPVEPSRSIAPVGAMVKASPSATIDANPWNTVIRRIADRLGIVGDGELVKTRAKEMQLQAWVGKLLAQVGRHAGGDKDKALFLVDQWADSKAFYFRGNNRSNWADAFNKWMMDDGPRQTATIRPSAAPPGAPSDWRELVYTHDGTRRAPALILPRIGLDRFTPAAAWPAWLRELEGMAV